MVTCCCDLKGHVHFTYYQSNGMLNRTVTQLQHANLGYQHVAAILKAQSRSMLQVQLIFTSVEHAAARHVVACKHWVHCLVKTV